MRIPTLKCNLTSPLCVTINYTPCNPFPTTLPPTHPPTKPKATTKPTYAASGSGSNSNYVSELGPTSRHTILLHPLVPQQVDHTSKVPQSQVIQPCVQAHVSHADTHAHLPYACRPGCECTDALIKVPPGLKADRMSEGVLGLSHKIRKPRRRKPRRSKRRDNGRDSG